MAETLKTKYDALVVGTGPGGATVAREMTNAGKKVLMLDWGSNAPIQGSKMQALGYIGMPYKSLYFINSGLGLVRAITVGGSSVVYYATAWEPPYEYWDKYGIDLRGEAAEIKKDVPIGPLKDELIGPSAKMIAKSALDLGYNWQKLNKFVYQDKCRSTCDKCDLGCPYGAKWNSRMFVEEATSKGAELLDLAHVTKVIVENKKATGVEFSRHGKKYIANADTVVVAAGGIGSPIILENSGIPQAGANFFYDPLIAVFGTVKGLDDGKEFPMAMGQHMVDDGYLMTDMTLPWLIYDVFTAEVFRFDKLSNKRPAHHHDQGQGHPGRQDQQVRLDKEAVYHSRARQADARLRARQKDTDQRRRQGHLQDLVDRLAPGRHLQDKRHRGFQPQDGVRQPVCLRLLGDTGRVGPAAGLSMLCLGKRLGKHLAGSKIEAKTTASV